MMPGQQGTVAKKQENAAWHEPEADDYAFNADANCSKRATSIQDEGKGITLEDANFPNSESGPDSFTEHANVNKRATEDDNQEKSKRQKSEIPPTQQQPMMGFPVSMMMPPPAMMWGFHPMMNMMRNHPTAAAMDPRAMASLQQEQNSVNALDSESQIVQQHGANVNAAEPMLGSMLAHPGAMPFFVMGPPSGAIGMPFVPRRGIPISLSCDNDQLSDYQILVRRQLELFEAVPEDIESNTQGRKKSVDLGQVGIRCRHCSPFPLRSRGRGAVYFPHALKGIYQAAQNMAGSHLCQSCQHIPAALKMEINELRSRRDNASGGKQYWADGCRALGVVETDAGLRMVKPLSKIKPSS